MKELVELIAKSLVDHPEEVMVKETDNERGVTIYLSVADDDMGKVIGKQGRIAKAIRTVVKAAATKVNKRINVEIIQ
ncbi:MAG: KH domain-containing protein [Halanaerobiales bacterium]|nr:KH domain-containing protein [Halanaerobiales bacterium]